MKQVGTDVLRDNNLPLHAFRHSSTGVVERNLSNSYGNISFMKVILPTEFDYVMLCCPHAPTFHMIISDALEFNITQKASQYAYMKFLSEPL